MSCGANISLRSVVAGDVSQKKEVEGFFEAAPPHVSEKLETETYRIAAWLMKRAEATRKVEQVNEDESSPSCSTSTDCYASRYSPARSAWRG